MKSVSEIRIADNQLYIEMIKKDTHTLVFLSTYTSTHASTHSTHYPNPSPPPLPHTHTHLHTLAHTNSALSPIHAHIYTPHIFVYIHNVKTTFFYSMLHKQSTESNLFALSSVLYCTYSLMHFSPLLSNFFLFVFLWRSKTATFSFLSLCLPSPSPPAPSPTQKKKWWEVKQQHFHF